jgi:hypothetical protein
MGAPGTFGEHVAGEEREQLVAPQDAPLAVDGADPVGVAVVADAEIRLLGAHGADQVLQVGFDRGIRRVVGVAAVGLAEQLHHVLAELLEDPGRERPRAAVAGVEHDLHLADRLHLGGQHVAIALAGGIVVHRPRPLLEVAFANEPQEALDGLAPHRLHAFAQLESVVLDRIVAARHLQAGVRAGGDDGVIEAGRRHLPHQRHLHAGRDEALGHALEDARAREPEVAPHGDGLLAAAAQVGAERLADERDRARP